jgi:branched-chain amino acid aminotransferase
VIIVRPAGCPAHPVAPHDDGMSLVWINGTLVDKSEAKISVFDHGFLYGDGVWTDLRAFGGKLLWPTRTLKLFIENFHHIEVPFTIDELQTAILETLQANSRKDGYIRVIATRGAGTLGPDPRKLDPTVIIIAEEYQPFPQELYEHGLHVVRTPVVPPDDIGSTLGASRTLVEAKRFALEEGCLEVIFLDESGNVLGGIEGGYSFIKDGMLHGRTHDMIFLMCWDGGVPIPPRVKGDHRVAFNTIHEFDEVFLAGTACGVIGIAKVDGKPIGTGREGPITKRIREAYRKLTRGESDIASRGAATDGSQG